MKRLDDDEFFEDIVRGSPRFHSSARDYYAEAHDRAHCRRQRDGSWVVTSHALAECVLRDRRFSFAGPPASRPDAMARFVAAWIEFLDGDEHREIRRSTAQAVVSGSADDVLGAVVGRRLDRLADAGADADLDLVQAFLHPLWLDLVQTWLGLPLRPFLPLMEDVRTVVGNLRRSAADLAVNDAADRLLATLCDIAAAARGGNGRGIVAASTLDGSDETVGVRALNLYTDAAPAVGAVGICIAALLADDALRDEVMGEPGAVAGAVHEMLRLDPPQVVLPRIATEPVTLDGKPVAAGERVAVVVGAVNYDPARFVDPTSFHRDREVAPLTFGAGSHACLGRAATVAVVTGALVGFFERFPGARLTGAPVWVAEPAMRRHEALPVRLTRRVVS